MIHKSPNDFDLVRQIIESWQAISILSTIQQQLRLERFLSRRLVAHLLGATRRSAVRQHARCRSTIRSGPGWWLLDQARAAPDHRVWRAKIRTVVPGKPNIDEVPHWQACEAEPDEGLVRVREVGVSAQRRQPPF